MEDWAALSNRFEWNWFDTSCSLSFTIISYYLKRYIYIYIFWPPAKADASTCLCVEKHQAASETLAVAVDLLNRNQLSCRWDSDVLCSSVMQMLMERFKRKEATAENEALWCFLSSLFIITGIRKRKRTVPQAKWCGFAPGTDSIPAVWSHLIPHVVVQLHRVFLFPSQQMHL